jgi:peptidoglycan DL-endopeptidase CwlO
MTEGLMSVQARIDQIQALMERFNGGTVAGARPSTAAGGTSASGSASGTTFDQVLAGAPAGSAGAAGSAGSAGSIGSAGEQVVGIARKYLGVNYRWGGTDPGTGLDCSGLTRLVYGQVGIRLPRTSADQARTGTPVASLAAARAGDLVFFGSPVHHVGIYLGEGKMLDAPRSGKPVQIRAVYETPSAIRRVLPAGPVAVTAAGAQGGSGPAAASLAGTPYADLFADAGRRYGLDPALLSAVAKTESGYRAGAISPAGARGMMQLMPATARTLGVDPAVPAQAVDGAARLLSDNLRTFNGRVDLALAAYNAGPSAVRKYGGVPPYAETRAYVQRVMTNWGDLR